MKTTFLSVFADRIQGKRGLPLRSLGLLAAALLLLTGPCLTRALADGGAPPSTYGPPPELPAGSQADDDTPRRDIHMGTMDHMYMGQDAEGNEVMEVRPRPKKNQNQQQQVGPFYIYPQIGSPQMPMGGQPGMGQPGMPSGSGQNGPYQYHGMPGSGQSGGVWSGTGSGS